jgi:uncharacterized cysteine cluster protein YcgN (CxxCxxCC family)
MSEQEWESLCDGCGKCCLVKLEDDDDGEVYYTNVACKLLDRQSCRCTDYDNRLALVPECVCPRKQDMDQFKWLPVTCTYRRLHEGKTLPRWHPLITDNKASVHRAKKSVSGKVVSELEVAEDDLEDHIVHWVN